MIAPAGGRRPGAMTLIEVVVATAVLALLVLVVASATVPLQRQASETVLLVDQEQRARRLLDPMRRELRQSGWNNDLAATRMFTLDPDGARGYVAQVISGTSVLTGSKTLIEFYTRTGLGEDDWTTTPVRFVAQRDGDFSGVPGTIPRFRLLRAADYDGDGTIASDEAIVLGSGISQLRLEWPPGAQRVYVRMQLTDPDPRRDGVGVPQPLQREFTDHIELLNGARN